MSHTVHQTEETLPSPGNERVKVYVGDALYHDDSPRGTPPWVILVMTASHVILAQIDQVRMLQDSEDGECDAKIMTRAAFSDAITAGTLVPLVKRYIA